MQVKKTPGALRLGLMAASCTLLGSRVLADAPAETPPADVSTDDEGPWQWDTALQYFKENHGLVNGTAPVVSLRKDLGGERVFTGSLQFATLSGSSPNGALPSKKLQTFATASGTRLNNPDGTPITYTTPSGQIVAQLATLALYQVQPYQQPTDPNYHEQRTALETGWSQPIARDTHFSIDGRIEDDSDCLSLGGTLGLDHSFNQRNTMLGLAVKAETDRVKPPGGTPVPGSDYRLTDKVGSKHKNATGGMLSWTQVLSSHWVSQLNYSYEKESGYLNNPYKIISVINGAGDFTDYRFESRPDKRTRHSLYFGNKVAMGPAVLDLSIRHGSDDWDVRGITEEAKVRFNIYGEDIYLEPHYRWYHQSAASFYNVYVDSGVPVPTYLSSDAQLGEFKSRSAGLKLGFLLQDQAELTLRLDLYTQTPSAKFRDSSLLDLRGFDLNPNVRTIVFQVGWRHGF
jgi:hypothetical protein